MKTKSGWVCASIFMTALAWWAPPESSASTAYGSLNNFDVVNDTTQECHGFEIELEDVRGVDITYTFNWNHYGTPAITEDLSVTSRPIVRVRWASGKKQDGSWAAYTAIPTGPIAPTDGHQFTNPNINFGGEHFGVGYQRVPTAVRYHWLVDDGSGNLALGPAVQISTPVFQYFPPPAPAVPAQIVAVIQPPEPPEIPPKEFGDAVWLKEIRTTTHNDRAIPLRDLVSDDPDDDNDPNWRNGEPDEVEVEWQLMQTEFSKPDGGPNGQLEGGPQELGEGDEVITRRYEFFEYIGPLDEETGEAKADKVGPDGIHGVIKTNEENVVVDYSGTEIVGGYLGAQMAAVQVEASVGLVEHIQDGVVGDPYPERKLVVSGHTPFTASIKGNLPGGMTFDPVAGTIRGTPDEPGHFVFTVSASDATITNRQQEYRVRIAGAGEILPPAFLLNATTYPANAGVVEGAGFYEDNQSAVINVSASPGYQFVSWTERGALISTNASLTVTMQINRALSANLELARPVTTITQTSDGTRYIAWPSEQVSPGWSVESSSNLVEWQTTTNGLSDDGVNKSIPIGGQDPWLFYRTSHP